MSAVLHGKKLNVVGLFAGLLFGAILAGANLHEYDSIHSFLKFEDLYIAWFMGSAIAVSGVLLWWLEGRGIETPFGGRLKLDNSMPQKNHWVGGAIFGVGWAIAGTCPAPSLVLVSSGALLGLVTMAGIFAGLHLRERQVARELIVMTRQANQAGRTATTKASAEAPVNKS